MEKIKSRWAKLAVIIAGSFLYTFGMNYFLIPYGLYSGGGVGIAQVLTYLLGKIIDFGGKNVYGIVYFLINIPLLVLAWKGIGKGFLVKTLIGSVAISIFASIIPIPATPIVDSVDCGYYHWFWCRSAACSWRQRWRGRCHRHVGS